LHIVLVVQDFHFDHSFNTFDDKDPEFADQEQVFNDIGTDVLDNAFNGYNACVFAYGQTGSGKTYTMMGTDSNPGVNPRICIDIFDRIAQNHNEHLSYKVEISFMEIYNEQVRDLLKPQQVGAKKKELKVREHKVLGPYVEGLTKLAVANYDAIKALMHEGSKARTVAKTAMNSESSRSHAVITLFVTQSLYDTASKQTGEKVSRICLVDLAGSERQGKTGASGARLKEGSNINKSLTTLGLCINMLAKRAGSGGGGTKKGKEIFVPYRDSILTWLLKDNLGGNAKTVMLAALSPASDNYEETLSTLKCVTRR
jgi:kinesin family protein 13